MCDIRGELPALLHIMAVSHINNNDNNNNNKTRISEGQ